MKHCIPLIMLIMLMLPEVADCQRYVNRYPNAGAKGNSRSGETLSERSKGFALRFGLEGGSMQMVSFGAEYEINPYVSVGAGVGGAYHIKAAWGLPLYAEARAYAPNRKYAAYINVRLGGVIGLGKGRMVPTNMDVYGYKLTNVDRLSGPYGGVGAGFSWRRLDAGIMFGVVYGKFHKQADYADGTFENWNISRKSFSTVSLHVSYSLPISRPPYNKVVTKH